MTDRFSTAQGTLVAMTTNFSGKMRKSPPSFFALALHNGLEDRNADGRVNSRNDPSISGRNLVSFGQQPLRYGY